MAGVWHEGGESPHPDLPWRLLAGDSYTVSALLRRPGECVATWTPHVVSQMERNIHRLQRCSISFPGLKTVTEGVCSTFSSHLRTLPVSNSRGM